MADAAALQIDTLEEGAASVRVHASGRWTFSGLKERQQELHRQLEALERRPPGSVAWDLSGVEDLDDAGMWVSRRTVTPVASVRLDNLPAEHRLASVEVRPVERLSGFADLWSTTLHASGIRLRNAVE